MLRQTHFIISARSEQPGTLGTNPRKVQQRESETDVCGQAQEGYWSSNYSGVEDTNEGQVRVACHCPRRLDLMMMIVSLDKALFH